MERFASGAWLDRSVARLMALAMLAAGTAAAAYVVATRTGTLDIWGRPLGTDFSLIWSAGRMALEGRAAEVYDWGLHHAAQKAAHGRDDLAFAGWHYPPPFLLVAGLLATMPYLGALALWQVATLAAALAAIRRILPDRDTLLVALGGPAVFVCAAHGHNGFLTAALFGGGLLLLDRRPWVAGALLGCLAYKPQLALVLPFALAAGGCWRAMGGAALAAGGLGLATLATFGPDVWTAFVASAGPTRILVLENGATGWYKIVSAFAHVRASGGSIALAYGVQATVSAAVVSGVTWLWWIRAPFRLRAAATMIGALLATPYVLDYDLALLGPAIAFTAAHGMRHGFRRWEITALAAAWFVPLVARHIAFFGGFPAGFAALSLLFGLLMHRAVRDRMADRQRDLCRLQAHSLIHSEAWSPRSRRRAPG